MGSNRPRLSEVREETRARPSAVREEIMAATLRTSGELGYGNLTVAAVLERLGGHRVQFYSHFASVPECYAEAHAAHVERLQRRLLEAGAAAESWRAGFGAALEELGRFADTEPLLAKGLLVQAHVAGGAVLDRRREVSERLSNALDSARRETGSRHSPPPLTASFMVSAIEAAVTRALDHGETERLRAETLPELEHLVSSVYFGLPPGPA